MAEHKVEWDKIWDISEIHIDGDDEAEYSLNYSIYHLNCIAPRNMKGTSIPARGLSCLLYTSFNSGGKGTGQAMALGVIIFLILIVFTIFYFYVNKKRCV